MCGSVTEKGVSLEWRGASQLSRGLGVSRRCGRKSWRWVRFCIHGFAPVDAVAFGSSVLNVSVVATIAESLHWRKTGTVLRLLTSRCFFHLEAKA